MCKDGLGVEHMLSLAHRTSGIKAVMMVMMLTGQV